MSKKVLLVDDDTQLLEGLRRQFRKRFDLSLANGAEEAVAALHGLDQYAVAVVDMRMPGMDGLALLQMMKNEFPETIRIMLTGNADQQTAVDAINQGNIFRFFSKPCGADVLGAAIEAALRQYDLERSEHILLESTLAGSVKVLVDVLSIADPVSFGRSERIRTWAEAIAKGLNLKQGWKLKMAATLSQLGNVAIPPAIMLKLSDGEDLTAMEQELVDRSPATAHDLIGNIPRLQPVADIVALQRRGYDGTGQPADGPLGPAIPLEARILRILLDLEKHTRSTRLDPTAFEALVPNALAYDPQLFDDIKRILIVEAPGPNYKTSQEVSVPVSLIRSGDALVTDLKLTSGRLILSAGNTITAARRHKIRAIGQSEQFLEPVRVSREGEGRSCLSASQTQTQEQK